MTPWLRSFCWCMAHQKCRKSKEIANPVEHIFTYSNVKKNYDTKRFLMNIGHAKEHVILYLNPSKCRINWLVNMGQTCNYLQWRNYLKYNNPLVKKQHGWYTTSCVNWYQAHTANFDYVTPSKYKQLLETIVMYSSQFAISRTWFMIIKSNIVTESAWIHFSFEFYNFGDRQIIRLSKTIFK